MSRGHKWRRQRRSMSEYEKACEGKFQYVSKHHAAHDAKALRHKSGDDISHYKCPHCPFFHVGHTPAWKKNDRWQESYNKLLISITQTLHPGKQRHSNVLPLRMKGQSLN